MKRIAFFFLSVGLLLLACNKITHIPATTAFYTIDFSKYSQEGFLFTPKEYTKKYKSIGLVDVILTAEMNKVKIDDHRGSKEWQYDDIKAAQGLEEMYLKAKKMGADAVMDLTIKTDYIETKPGLPSIPRLTLSGFAIKRTE